MRSHTLDSASVIISCFTALYFAPMASWSNSGSCSCQTFNVSTTIELSSDLHASMNDLVRVIESEDSPLGDDWISRNFTWSLRVWGLLAEPKLLRARTCCTLDYICNFLGMRDVD